MNKLFNLFFVSLLILFVFQSCSDDILGTDSEKNTPPVAKVDSEQEVEIGAKVILDGSDSYDPDEDELTYSWEILSKPQESEAILHNPDSVKASFTPDARGSYQIQLTVSDGKDNNSATLSATADIMVLGNITEDKTLTNIFEDPEEPDYVVSDISDVKATLTIEPGVHIEFGSGARMEIESEGTLIATGTEDAPIRFTGAVKSPGSWDGIRFKSISPNNELSHAIIEYGGNNYANISINYNGGVTINHTTSRFSSTYGLEAENEAQLRDFSNNVFAGNETAIMKIPANLIGALDISSDYNGESGSAYIAVDNVNIETKQTWPAIEVPYVIDGNIDIKEEVNVKPGVTFKFNNSARLDIEGEGGLSAIGTADSPIKFLGSQATPGHWQGIRFKTKNNNNELTYTEVSHGGANGYANVTVDYNGAVNITNSLFTMSGTFGLDVKKEGIIRDFNTNTFESDAGINIPANLIGILDYESTYIGSAGTGTISVFSSSVSNAQSWPGVDAPYIIDGTIDIKEEVTVKPGATFKFNNSARLDIEGEGSLNAIGTADSLIKFLGSQEIPGQWGGIRFKTKNPANALTYTEVSHGGANEYANVLVDYNGAVKITNSALKSSQTYGLEVKSDGELRDFSNNTISSDAIIRIPAYLIGKIDENSNFEPGGYISVNGTNVETDQTWISTSVPYIIESNVDILADITINPGAILEFDSGVRIDIESGTNGGSLKAVGTQSDSIKFIGTTNVQGHWQGLRFKTMSNSNLLEYCVVSDGGRDGYANIKVSYNGGVTVNNSSIRNSETYGVEVSSDGEFNESGNTYSNNKLGAVNRQ